MAGYPTATGHPNMSGGYIPMLYATMLLVAFYNATVLGAITNTEYEGELQKAGDTLRIRTLPDIPNWEYVKGQQLQSSEPDPSYIDLVIDKGRYWNFFIDPVDKKQADIDYISKWAEHASMGMKVEIDSAVLGDIYGDVAAANTGLTAGAVSSAYDMGTDADPVILAKTDIIDTIVDAGSVLDEQNIPDDSGRFMVLPAWACGMIKKSDLKDASMTGDGKSILRNGRIGMIDRFEIYRSNNLAVTSVNKHTCAIFGHKCATAFASQMLNTEEYTSDKRFGKGHRSLQVYGYKVVKPEALGCLMCAKS